MTDQTAVDRIPIAHSVRYAARGLPEVPYQYGRGVLRPCEITLTYRAAPDSQLGRVHAYVAGRIYVDGQEIPHAPYGQHYDDGLDGWPAWLTDEARLHDPAVPAPAVPAPATEQAAELRGVASYLHQRGTDLDDGGLTAAADLLLRQADAVLAVLPTTTDRAATLRELEQRQRPNTPPSRPDASPTAPPVQQRADCTELEWAVQERARFERLYTRETVRADLAEQRADTAARDADIYQKRLERLSEGYTEQRKRAEAMERAMESTAADALAHRGCHRDLMAQCQRAERAEAEAEQLRASRAEVPLSPFYEHPECGFRWHGRDDMDVPMRDGQPVCPRCELARQPTVADRTAVLREAAERVTGHAADHFPEEFDQYADQLADVLRRLAVGTQQPTPCSEPNGCDPDGDLCDRHETERAHAEGEHAFCGPECDKACTCAAAGDAFVPLGHYADCPQSAAVQQPKEADNPRTVCVCGHTRAEHLTVSGRLLCDECVPDSTDDLVCKEFEAL